MKIGKRCCDFVINFCDLLFCLGLAEYVTDAVGRRTASRQDAGNLVEEKHNSGYCNTQGGWGELTVIQFESPVANSSAETAANALRTHNSGTLENFPLETREYLVANRHCFNFMPYIQSNKREICELGIGKDLERGSHTYVRTNGWYELISVRLGQ
jgi:hypothetical protein